MGLVVALLILIAAFALGLALNPWFWLLLIVALVVASATRGSW